MATTNNPNKKPQPPIQDETIIFEGKKMTVSSLTEEQAKNIVRAIAREHRLFAESINTVLSLLGPRGMFAEDDLPPNMMPPPETVQ